MRDMDKDKVKKRNADENTEKEVNKIRKVSKGDDFTSDTKQDKVTKSDKVTKKLRKEKPPSLSKVNCKSSLEVLLEGLTNVELGEELGSLLIQPRFRNEDFIESPSTSRDSFSPIERAANSPRLQSNMITTDIMHVVDDIISDAESDFCPDWSSGGSFSSGDNLDVDDSDVIEEKDSFFCPENKIQFSVQRMGDDYAELSPYGALGNVANNTRSTAFTDVTNLPIPAAGNEKERTLSSQTTSSDGRNSPVSRFRPQAIRRVKSMIYEVTKDNEVNTEQRTCVLMRKHARDITPSQISMSPSPLLSPEDAGSIKRSPSQVSVKYCLKRSRSNLTVAENFIKKHPIFEGDVIHEESDDDARSDITTDTDIGIEMKTVKDADVASQSNDDL